MAFAWLAGCGVGDAPLDEIRALHEAGRYEESLEPLEQLLDERPGEPELLFLYGVANMGAQKPSLALWPLREARGHPEWAVRAGTALAQAALSVRDHGTAIEAASRILETEPDNEGIRNLRAEAHLQANRYEDALADAEYLLEIQGDHAGAQLVRLRSLIGLERLDEVEALFDELGEESQGGVPLPELIGDRYCAARASFAHQTEKLELAEERFEECLERYPTGPSLIQEALAFFEDTGRPERAIEILRSALETEPMLSSVRELLAVRLRAADRPDEAESLLLAGTELGTSAAFDAWGALAAHYFQLGDYAKSVSAWERVLEARDDPPAPDHVFGYAEALIRAGHHERAFEVAAGLPEVYAELVRGLARLEQDRPGEALRHFDAGLRLWPNHAVARHYAGIAAERTGDFDRAISEYRASVRAGAAQTDAGLRLARLHEAEGAFEPAWQALALHLEAHPQDPESHLAALRIAARRGRGVPALAGPRAADPAAVAQGAEIVATTLGSEAAIDFLGQASRVDFSQPEAADALRVLVSQLVAAGRGDEANRRIDAALAAHPDAAAFHEIRALARERSGAAPAEVSAGYRRATELDPDHAPAWAALGRLAAAAGESTRARDYFARAAQADPDDVDSRRRAAELTAEAGDSAEAQQRFEALLREHPYDGRAATGLALLVRERDSEQARALVQRAARFGGGPPAYALLVDLHLAADEAERAARALEAIALRRRSDPSLHYQLGRALAAAGDPTAARGAFERALAAESFPERSEAAAALAALAERSGDG